MKRFTNIAALTAVAFGMVLVSVAAGADVVVGCYADGCHQDCGKTVCRPVCEVKTVTKRVYTDRCTDVCLPCPLACLFPSGCGCSHVHRQKELVVKLRKREECVRKCVPVHVPTCTTCAPTCTSCVPTCSTPCAPACAPSAPMSLPGVVVIPTVTTMPSGPIAMPNAK